MKVEKQILSSAHGRRSEKSLCIRNREDCRLQWTDKVQGPDQKRRALPVAVGSLLVRKPEDEAWPLLGYGAVPLPYGGRPETTGVAEVDVVAAVAELVGWDSD